MLFSCTCYISIQIITVTLLLCHSLNVLAVSSQFIYVTSQENVITAQKKGTWQGNVITESQSNVSFWLGESGNSGNLKRPFLNGWYLPMSCPWNRDVVKRCNTDESVWFKSTRFFKAVVWLASAWYLCWSVNLVHAAQNPSGLYIKTLGETTSEAREGFGRSTGLGRDSKLCQCQHSHAGTDSEVYDVTV